MHDDVLWFIAGGQVWMVRSNSDRRGMVLEAVMN